MTSNVSTRDVAGTNPAAFLVIRLFWAVYSIATVLFAVFLTFLSRQFSLDFDMTDRPIIVLILVLVLANALCAVFLPKLVAGSAGLSAEQRHLILSFIVASGLIARLALFSSQPILENDYQRYLWDGGVTAHAQNPYRLSPAMVISQRKAGELGSLAQEGGDTIRRIGHKELTTIYPPVAQGAFAIAHFLAPWSLNGWRAILLVGDLATLALLLVLLDGVGRSRLWVALYWLNPLVLKEAFNSAHMEPILAPLVLASLYLAWQRRNALSTVFLALASGVKLWPAILSPLLLRNLDAEKRKQAGLAFLLGAAMTLWIVPMLVSSSIEYSGTVAYAGSWQTNGALYPGIEASVAALISRVGLTNAAPSFISRVFIGAIIITVALGMAWRRWLTLDDLLFRAGAIVAALLLLSPAQYPWYALWFAPFAVFNPSPAFRMLMTTLPLYYASFYFAANDRPEIFTSYVVWMIWIPVWLALAWEFKRRLVPDRTGVTHSKESV